MRKQAKATPPPFSGLLRDRGWLLKTAPILAFIDDEYVYVDRADRLKHLHISAGSVEWEARRYTREPFGDYTTVFRPLGCGKGINSLQNFLDDKESK